MEMVLRHQKTMLALRELMGWPVFKPANDCIAFTSGKPTDFQVGMELGRISQMINKDVIYSEWASPTTTAPVGFCIAFRELLSVDIIDRVLPYAADGTSPIVLVSTRADEHFAIDGRGSLTRVNGKPKSLGAGRRLAMKRIKAAAKVNGDELLAGNRHIPWGATSNEPDAPAECVVRFG